MEPTPTLTDRLWAAAAFVLGLLAVNGGLLALTALSDGSPIPFAAGSVGLVLGTLGSRATWRRTSWAAHTAATGVGIWEQQRTRHLRPGEVLLQRAVVMAMPIVALAVVAAAELPWTNLLVVLGLTLLHIATTPAHQRRQLLGRS